MQRKQQPPGPLVTYALFAYNQEKYIRDAIKTAFAQSHSPLEIWLSDDKSTDNTFLIMQEMAATYIGPHQVHVRQSDKNAGVMKHVLDVARLAAGDLFVVAAGDDLSRPNRVSRLVHNFVDDSVYAISTGDSIINELGELIDVDRERFQLRKSWHSRLPTWIHGATAAYRTSFLANLPVPTQPLFDEDAAFADIAHAIGHKSLLIADSLVEYRYHSSNLSIRIQAKTSHEERERLSQIRQKRMLLAKLYSLKAIETLASCGARVNPKIRDELEQDARRLEFFASWQSRLWRERLCMLTLSRTWGDRRSALLRLFGPQIFLVIKNFLR